MEACHPSSEHDLDGNHLLGKPAPEWDQLQSFEGKTLLIRWWTDGCVHCTASAPVLEEIHKELKGQDSAVVGVYHPKPPRPVTQREAQQMADHLGMTFPVILDLDWSWLERFWPDEKSFTSVTFLLDRAGFIRRIHPGGTIKPAEGAELVRAIKELL